jgi:hypothetical protein
MDSNRNQLAQVANWQNTCRNVDGEANAQLMASAPDMALEIARLNEVIKHIHNKLKHISECSSMPERDAEELTEFVSGFIDNEFAGNCTCSDSSLPNAKLSDDHNTSDPRSISGNSVVIRL